MSWNAPSIPVGTRPADDTDRPFLTWLEEACMRDYAVALWGVWRARPAGVLDLQHCRILVASSLDVGCVTVRREADHLWVDALYVAPAFQNRGIGTETLRLVLSEGAAEGLPVRLSVLTTNPALDFYVRNGLAIERETAEHRYLTTTG